MARFPDGATLRSQDHWRDKVVEAQMRYGASQTDQNKTEYLRLLRVFADLVIKGQPPKEVV